MNEHLAQVCPQNELPRALELARRSGDAPLYRWLAAGLTLDQAQEALDARMPLDQVAPALLAEDPFRSVAAIAAMAARLSAKEKPDRLAWLMDRILGHPALALLFGWLAACIVVMATTRHLGLSGAGWAIAAATLAAIILWRWGATR